MFRGYGRISIGLILAIFLIFLFISIVGIDKIMISLSRANYFFILVALLLSLSMAVIRSRVWQENLGKLGNNLNFLECLGAVYSSLFVSSFFRGGQPLTAYLLSRRNKFRVERNYAAMMAHDMLNWISSYIIISSGAIFYVFINPNSPLNSFILMALIILGIVILCSIYVLWKKESFLEHVAIFTGDLLYKIRCIFRGESINWKKKLEEKFEWEIHEFEKALHLIFNNRKHNLKLFVFTFIERLFSSLIIYFLLLSLNIKIPIFLAFLINPLSGLFNVIPLPGGIGGVEIGLTSVLIFLFNLNLTVAASAAILYRIINYFIPVILGAISLWFLSSEIPVEVMKSRIP